MIKELVKKWDKNKDKLEQYFKETPMSEFESYESIFKKLIEFVINDEQEYWKNYNLEKLIVIESGGYSGTMLFIITRNDFDGLSDCIATTLDYGSCSLCDTMEYIISQGFDKYANKEQIKGFMMLALNLLQNMKKLGD
jgi:hypothetical protein